MDKTGVLHKIIDVLSGRQASLSAAEADEMREALTPGSTAPGLSQSESDTLATLQAKQAAAEAASSAAPADDGTS